MPIEAVVDVPLNVAEPSLFDIKSKTVSEGNVEITVEMRLSNDETNIVNEFSELSGVHSSVLVKYDGNYVS